MQQTCANQWCKQQFEITDDDLAFYEKVSPVFNGKKELIPPPTRCPECRQQRRLAFRNERNIYHRSCNTTGEKIVSLYSKEKQLNIMNPNNWWSDKWDPCDYGKNIDFNTSFLKQIHILLSEVPLLSNMVFNCTNSEFNSFCVDSKNIYLSARVGDSEDISYSYLPLHCINSIDCYDIFHCQNCYECIDCWNCYNAQLCQNSKNITDCTYCYDCIGCKNCFGCAGLRNVEYHIFNKKYEEEEYIQQVLKFYNGTNSGMADGAKQFANILQKHKFRSVICDNTENAIGNYISNSKDIFHCFDIEQTETSSHSTGVEYAKDVHDCNFIYYGEECHENISNSKSTNIHYSFVAIGGVHNLWYSMFCFNNTQNCFGCISLKQKQYCILNKQYTKEEYNRLVPKIIEKMRADGEWGEFFPVEMSPFAYNETVAQEYFPLTKEKVEKRGRPADHSPPKEGEGWKWRDETDEIPQVDKIIPADRLPDSIDDIPDDILNWAIKCEVTGRPFRIVKQELTFYRKMKLPIPHLHPDERHKRRMALRNPRKLWKRKCDKCGKEIETTYSPDRPEIVYCEKCYLKEVY